MKVLQLTSHFSPNVGGVETHLDDLIKELLRKDISVGVLTYRPLTTKAKWKLFEKKENFFVIRLPWIPGFFYKLVKNPAIELLYLFPGLFVAVPFVLLFQNPNVIHAHGLVAGIAGVIWGKIFRKKVVLSLHNIYHFPKTGLYRKVVVWLFMSADKTICLSKQSQEEVLKLAIPQAKVGVFTYWVDQELFQQIPNAKEILKASGQFVVLFVGRLVEEKGIKELLSASKGLPTGITVIIAGNGPMESMVKSVADGKRIIYAGKISQKDLPLYYSAANVLIVPSVHEEGFGRVMLEALSCGTPVIAANRGGIIEALNTSVGYLIDISPQNIEKAVVYCYKHAVELEKKSREARKFAKEKYSSKNIESIIKAYE